MSDTTPQPTTTPLTGLRVLVLDTETTGLDVSRARIVSVGAVCVDGNEIEPDRDLSLLVDPGKPIPADSTRIHGLSDDDVAGAGDFSEHASALDEAMRGRVLVGHNIGFDLAILAREHERAGRAWAPPTALDTGLLAGALRPDLPDTSLETVAAWLGIDTADRHSALGDARTTAEIYVGLLPLLAGAGVRSLAEARRFTASRNGDTMRRHAEAGWHVAATAEGAVRTPADTFAYRHTLAELMSAPPVFVAPETPLGDAIATMSARGIGAVLVGDAANPVGIVTERDIVRRLADPGTDALAQPVERTMSRPVTSLPSTSPAYRAIARLERLGIRHVAVTAPDGTVAGMVSARDLLRRSASAALVLGDEIAQASSPAELARAFARTPQAAERLRAEELGARRIAGLISEEVRALTARAADLAIAEIGPPPGAWALMVLGSAGRGESLLVPDQDNALIHADAPGMESWAESFGTRVNDILDTAGLPYCKGGVMAGKLAWRHTMEGWRDQVTRWVRRAGNEDLLNVDIFFDLRHVAGVPGMTEELQTDALNIARTNPVFIRALNDSVAGLQTPVGMFGRLRGIEGRLDIKAAGLLPVVAFARATALRHGVAAHETPARLEAAIAAGALPESDGTQLIEMHRSFVELALDQQLADIAAGSPPSYRVELARLDRATRRDLADALSNLDDILSLAWSTLST